MWVWARSSGGWQWIEFVMNRRSWRPRLACNSGRGYARCRRRRVLAFPCRRGTGPHRRRHRRVDRPEPGAASVTAGSFMSLHSRHIDLAVRAFLPLPTVVASVVTAVPSAARRAARRRAPDCGHVGLAERFGTDRLVGVEVQQPGTASVLLLRQFARRVDREHPHTVGGQVDAGEPLRLGIIGKRPTASLPLPPAGTGLSLVLTWTVAAD